MFLRWTVNMKWKRAIKCPIREWDVMQVKVHLSLREEELTGGLWLDTIRQDLLMTSSPEAHPGLLTFPLTLELMSAQISPQLQELQRRDASQSGQTADPLHSSSSYNAPQSLGNPSELWRSDTFLRAARFFGGESNCNFSDEKWDVKKWFNKKHLQVRCACWFWFWNAYHFNIIIVIIINIFIITTKKNLTKYHNCNI